jgi:hypothetical protein
MKRLLRILFTVRRLILVGTLALAIFGSYLVREAAPSATEIERHPASQVQVCPTLGCDTWLISEMQSHPASQVQPPGTLQCARSVPVVACLRVAAGRAPLSCASGHEEPSRH